MDMPSNTAMKSGAVALSVPSGRFRLSFVPALSSYYRSFHPHLLPIAVLFLQYFRTAIVGSDFSLGTIVPQRNIFHHMMAQQMVRF
jgi:hypothetical protein